MQTYLFDKHNSCRSTNRLGNKGFPELIWKTELTSFPKYGAESTPAIDSFGNLYFGAHSGLFYSIDSKGKILWSFLTQGKIYSSPCLLGNSVYFGSGDGNLYSLSLEGHLNWVYSLRNVEKKFENFKGKWILDLISKSSSFVENIAFKRLALDGIVTRKKLDRIIRIWASPKLTSDGRIVIVGVGKGLHIINAEDGKCDWDYDLGNPYFHVAGAALDLEDNIYVPSFTKKLTSLTKNGEIRWQYQDESDYVAWGMPSIDTKNGLIFHTRSFRETSSVIICNDLNGNLLWRIKLESAIRGSIAISDYSYVCAGLFNGELVFIDKLTGEIFKRLSLTSSRRGLWTTPSIDADGNILVSVKTDRIKGKIVATDHEGSILWEWETYKVLNTPVLDGSSRLFFGNWNGEYICLQT